MTVPIDSGMLRRVLLVPLGWDLELRSADGIAKELDRIESEDAAQVEKEDVCGNQSSLPPSSSDTSPSSDGVTTANHARTMTDRLSRAEALLRTVDEEEWLKGHALGDVIRAFLSAPAPVRDDLDKAMALLRALDDGGWLLGISLGDEARAMIAAYDAQRGRKGGTSE